MNTRRTPVKKSTIIDDDPKIGKWFGGDGGDGPIRTCRCLQCDGIMTEPSGGILTPDGWRGDLSTCQSCGTVWEAFPSGLISSVSGYGPKCPCLACRALCNDGWRLADISPGDARRHLNSGIRPDAPRLLVVALRRKVREV